MMKFFSYQKEAPVNRRAMFAASHTKRKSLARYDWRTYSPDDPSLLHKIRWFMVGGGAYARQTDDQMVESLAGLAKCLTLLRQYLETYGMPDFGGDAEQHFLLRQIVRDLYAGGAPLWALDGVLQKAAEGLTGDPKVNWLLLPRKAFCSSDSKTSMFKIDRGFDIAKLSSMEAVAVRLASFASNTESVSDIAARFPAPEELNRTAQQSVREGVLPADKMAEEILDLASATQGLFFFSNSSDYAKQAADAAVDDFWKISAEERELFSRLACAEALATIRELDAEQHERYSPLAVVVFRVLASAGACAFWFNGSWQDMIVAGVLAVVVAAIGSNRFLSKQEKIVFETVASFVVGLTSGLIALTWPDETCFGAMAIAGVLDILQGFRVVYAIIEIMSKHTVSGSADLMEGILFTGLIAYFLRFGEYVAARILSRGSFTEFTPCTSPISAYWYILLVPLASLSWSGLFTPEYQDLIPMALHGCLAYGVNYGLSQAGADENVNNFVSACLITLSSGVVSRFTGRQAVGNTVAGLYVLLPGAYLVTSLFSAQIDSSFFLDIIQKAVVIGIGAWTGSLLCSPTLLGTTSGLLNQQSQHASNRSFGRVDTSAQPNTMLIF